MQDPASSSSSSSSSRVPKFKKLCSFPCNWLALNMRGFHSHATTMVAGTLPRTLRAANESSPCVFHHVRQLTQSRQGIPTAVQLRLETDKQSSGEQSSRTSAFTSKRDTSKGLLRD